MTVLEYERLFKQNFERLYYHSLDSCIIIPLTSFMMRMWHAMW